jgi:hypothetical protein
MKKKTTMNIRRLGLENYGKVSPCGLTVCTQMDAATRTAFAGISSQFLVAALKKTLFSGSKVSQNQWLKIN